MSERPIAKRKVDPESNRMPEDFARVSASSLTETVSESAGTVEAGDTVVATATALVEPMLPDWEVSVSEIEKQIFINTMDPSQYPPECYGPDRGDHPDYAFVWVSALEADSVPGITGVPANQGRGRRVCTKAMPHAKFWTEETLKQYLHPDGTIRKGTQVLMVTSRVRRNIELRSYSSKSETDGLKPGVTRAADTGIRHVEASIGSPESQFTDGRVTVNLHR